MPVGVGGHERVAEFQGGRLQRDREVECRPFLVEPVDIVTRGVVHAEFHAAWGTGGGGGDLHAVTVLLRLGFDVRVESPAEIKTKLLNHIDQIAKLYRPYSLNIAAECGDDAPIAANLEHQIVNLRPSYSAQHRQQFCCVLWCGDIDGPFPNCCAVFSSDGGLSCGDLARDRFSVAAQGLGCSQGSSYSALWHLLLSVVVEVAMLDLYPQHIERITCLEARKWQISAGVVPSTCTYTSWPTCGETRSAGARSSHLPQTAVGGDGMREANTRRPRVTVVLIVPG